MTNLYKYGGSIIKNGCCCDDNPPPPPECPPFTCDFSWIPGLGGWIALSVDCGQFCQCESFPVNPPGPGDPEFLSYPCVPIT